MNAPDPEDLADGDPEASAALYALTFPCPLCGGRVKPWCQPTGATAHYSCVEHRKQCLDNLVACLEVAAGLCRAFRQGQDSKSARWYSWEPPDPWRPGCNLKEQR